MTFQAAGKTREDAGLCGEKESLKADVSVKRAGVVSDISDVKFIITVLKNELHKTHIDTLGEMLHIRKKLFEENAYDWSTGEKNDVSQKTTE